MKGKYCPVLVALVLLSPLIACQESLPLPAMPVPADISETRPAWQQTWDELLVGARKEGRAVIYTTVPAEVREALYRAFREKHGIELEFMAGRAAELSAKVATERRAGVYTGDVALLGFGGYVEGGLKEIPDPVFPLPVLPDVTDTSRLFQGKLPLLDRDGHAFALVMAPSRQDIFNTDLVKEGEISGARDYPNPKWKGKVVLSDPSATGSANSWYHTVLKSILGVEEGRAYMRELAKNAALISRDYRQNTEWVARGKYAIAVGIRSDEPTQFMQLGAPIEFVVTNEPRQVNPLWGLLNVYKNWPHPDATQVFANWLLTREGMSELAQSSLRPTTRVDVPSESIGSISPVLLPRSNDVMISEDMQEEKSEMMRMKADFAAF